MITGGSTDGLKRQKARVEDQMSATRSKISALDDKVSRLRDVASSMEHSILSLRNIKGNIEDFEVQKVKWKGEEMESFSKKYNLYIDGVDRYDSDTSKAKEQIDDALEQARKERATAQIDLENLGNTLSGLNADISKAEEA